MKLRNKKTGEIVEVSKIGLVWNKYGMPADIGQYNSLSELNEEWEDYKPVEPLIKDEKIRKAVRAWADVNGFSFFKVYNQHRNYVKIYGVEGRYDTNGTIIEFRGTIAGVETRTYEIYELCGEGEE